MQQLNPSLVTSATNTAVSLSSTVVTSLNTSPGQPNFITTEEREEIINDRHVKKRLKLEYQVDIKPELKPQSKGQTKDLPVQLFQELTKNCDSLYNAMAYQSKLYQ